MFLRSSVDMVKVRPEDLNYTKMRAISWTLLVLAIVVIEIEITDLL